MSNGKSRGGCRHAEARGHKRTCSLAFVCVRSAQVRLAVSEPLIRASKVSMRVVRPCSRARASSLLQSWCSVPFDLSLYSSLQSDFAVSSMTAGHVLASYRSPCTTADGNQTALVPAHLSK